MTPDPIVEEVRAVREAFAKRHDYDIEAIVRALQEASVREGRQLVTLAPKPLTETDRHRRAS